MCSDCEDPRCFGDCYYDWDTNRFYAGYDVIEATAQDLRDEEGYDMMTCRAASKEADGDFDKALEIIKRKMKYTI